jgi:hypothetical protein
MVMKSRETRRYQSVHLLKAGFFSRKLISPTNEKVCGLILQYYSGQGWDGDSEVRTCGSRISNLDGSGGSKDQGAKLRAARPLSYSGKAAYCGVNYLFTRSIISDLTAISSAIYSGLSTADQLLVTIRII